MRTSSILTWIGAAVLAALTTSAAAESAADRAVEAARKYSGTTINMIWPAGVGALGQKVWATPKFKALTGVTVNVIEAPPTDVYTKIVAEHRAGTGGYDVVSMVPAWMADLTSAGMLEPLDASVRKFGFEEELALIEPAYRDNWMRAQGRIMAIPDDGDVLILFYRKDLFEDPKNKAAFKAKYGYELAVPKTWEQFNDIGWFFTNAFQPDLYGAAAIHAPGLMVYSFQERFRNAGGKFFDEATMTAQINGPAGIKAATQIQDEAKFMPPGSENWNPVQVLGAWLGGKVAMMSWWPPPGRWSEGYGTDQEALKWVPESKVKGKVGYALSPGGRPELALGWSLGVSSNSKHKELAYLYVQWVNSEEISLQRVQLPYSLRDPFRTSHFESAEYRSRWANAGEYLDVLREGAQTGMLDLSIRNTFQYDQAVAKAMSRLMAGEDPTMVMDDAARQWDRITRRTGVDAQRTTYQEWAAKPNAYPR